MENIILIVILVVILVPAVRHTYLRFSGKKSCCGGTTQKVKVKKLDAPVIETYDVQIEGMHCENCKNSVMRHLNELDGVSVKVDLGKKKAVVSCSKPTDPELIRNTIDQLGYEAVKIEKK
ncbi:MAG: heavy metal-associated domain-containing protein [Lachnospiraceae bacterium]|nr:heavy metal-associated domain-containing protein [Lachnospiraceae bacterium]